MPFTFNYTLTDADYLDYNMHVFTKSSYGKKMLWLIRLCLPLMFLIELAVQVRKDVSVLVFLINIALVLVLDILWLAFSGILFRAIMRAVIKAQKKDGSLAYSKQGTITVDENGITDKGENSEFSVGWDGIEKVLVISKFGIIYMMNSQAGIIFKNDLFETEEQKNALLAASERYIPTGKFVFKKK